MGERERTHFADALKDADGMLEVADMEDGYTELDVRVVPHAVHT